VERLLHTPSRPGPRPRRRGRAAEEADLSGFDVVYCSGGGPRIDTVAWHDALRPRATHLLASDAITDAAVVIDGDWPRALAHSTPASNWTSRVRRGSIAAPPA
jgi:hypothetical protein